MRGPSTCDLLDAWERGLELPVGERPLALLSAAEAKLPLEQVRELPIGERDARLLELREWAFGSRLEAVIQCPSCGAELELAFAVADLLAGSHARESNGGAEHTLRVDDLDLCFRLPDSAAMGEAGAAGTVDAARSALLRHCVVSVTRGTEPLEPRALTPSVVERIEAAMAELDPQADIRLAVSCSECAHQSEAVFDSGSFLWAEVDRWARRVLGDVAILASAFGWSEQEVLQLTPLRRAAYLELAGR